MFDSLLDQIPASIAIMILIVMVIFNFCVGTIKLIYHYFSQKSETTIIEKMEENLKELKQEIKEMNAATIREVDTIEKITNEATAQIGIILAHYDSEVKFRKLLEDKVNSIEKQLLGNGKPSMDTEIELLKQKVEIHEIEITKLSTTGKKTK